MEHNHEHHHGHEGHHHHHHNHAIEHQNKFLHNFLFFNFYIFNLNHLVNLFFYSSNYLPISYLFLYLKNIYIHN